MPRIEGKFIINNRISELRAQFSWTQQGLADRLNITRCTVIALEKGSYNPSLELAFRVAKLFQTHIEDIFFIKDKHDE